jgi:hypothetical protein
MFKANIKRRSEAKCENNYFIFYSIDRIDMSLNNFLRFNIDIDIIIINKKKKRKERR